MLENGSLYAKFNIFSLLFNFSLFLLCSLFKCLAHFPISLFYLALVLKLTLIFFSLLHYYVIVNHEAKIKETNRKKIYRVIMEQVYDFVPLFEFLIDINLDLSFNLIENDFFQAYLLKPGYFFCKIMLNDLRQRKKSWPFTNLMHLFFILVITLNLALVFPIENYRFLTILIGDSILILVCFFCFSRIVINSITYEQKLMGSYLNAMGESILIVEETKKKRKKEKNYKIVYLIDQIFNLRKLQKKGKVSFEELNSNIGKFHSNECEISVKTDILTEFQLQSSESHCFDSLREMFSFYNSLNNNEILMKFLEIDQNDNSSSLVLTMKKAHILKKVFFFVNIHKIEKIVKIKKKTDYETRLLNSISHELKTPLNGTLTLLELMWNQEQEESNPEPNIYLENSLASLKLLENTLNNIIDYSLMLSDQFIICMSNVNLYSLMQEIITITKSQIQLKHVNYSIELDEIFSKKPIYTDYTRLKQIILNITLNCIQFTNNGNIKIMIHLLSLKKPSIVEISIQDTGIGMDPVFCSNLMEKLNKNEDSQFQANSTSSCMGLTISQKLALLLGKTGLQFESKLNEGTMVKFTILDQNLEEKFSIPNIPIDNIVIEDHAERPKVNRFATIIDDSMKIEFLRQKQKTLKKKENSLESFEEIGSQVLSSKLKIMHDSGYVSMNSMNHHFDSLVRPMMWFDPHSKSKSKEVHENSFHSIGLKKKMASLPRKSESNSNFIFPENEGSPLFLRTKSVCTSENKNKEKNCLPKENIDCKCEDILIVDDDAFNLLSLEMILKNFHIRCLKAMNGKEAVECVVNQNCSSLRCRGFKLIFMDYQMPIMDGVESAKEILKLKMGSEDVEGRKISIIGCTAFTTKKEVENFLNAGLKDVIFKPLNKQIVGNVLHEWLE